MAKIKGKLLIVTPGNDTAEYFFDGVTGEFITGIHCNDGHWRTEYFNPLIEHWGITSTRIGIERFLTHNELQDYSRLDDEGDTDRAEEILIAAVARFIKKKR